MKIIPNYKKYEFSLRTALMTRMLMACCVAVALALLVAGCGGSPARKLLQDVEGWPQSPERFSVCKGYGCDEVVLTSLSSREWARVEAVFVGPPGDAASERLKIAEAVGEMERLVGLKTGTEADAPGAAIINFIRQGQMDCIDEAFNTTLYLRMMADAGLLRRHDVGEPARRGYVVDGWPHNTATVHERDTGRGWAVDSWFHGNGVPPEIVPLEDWLDGWKPEKGKPARP